MFLRRCKISPYQAHGVTVQKATVHGLVFILPYLISYLFVLNESRGHSVPQDIEDVLISNFDLTLSANIKFLSQNKLRIRTDNSWG